MEDSGTKIVLTPKSLLGLVLGLLAAAGAAGGSSMLVRPAQNDAWKDRERLAILETKVDALAHRFEESTQTAKETNQLLRSLVQENSKR